MAKLIIFYKQLDHYIIPSLVYNKPDTVLIHVGTNNTLQYDRYEDIAWNITRIGSNYKSHGVKDIFILSIFVKKNPMLYALIRSVNDMLDTLCVMNSLILFVIL